MHRMRVRQAVHYLAAALGIALLVSLDNCRESIPYPQIGALSPKPISADTVSVVLSVEGSGFVPQSVDPVEPKPFADDVHRFTSPANHGYTRNI